MDRNAGSELPLHIAQSLQAAEKACNGADASQCIESVLHLADALIYHLGAVAAAQYSQALYSGQIEADPTLNRSLRSLRRVLPGQWLIWTARGLDNTPNSPVEGLTEWYISPLDGGPANAYEAMRNIMVEQMDYLDEHGQRDAVSPRELLEMVDRFKIRRGKVQPVTVAPETEAQIATALLAGLRDIIEAAAFLPEYPLYAPQRQLLMGTKPTTPMPPISAPGDVAAAATILLYPPGEAPDYTKRPNLQAERVPLFPLDPLLVYIRCGECDRNVVAALSEVAGGEPLYLGLDPRCNHKIKVPNSEF